MLKYWWKGSLQECLYLYSMSERQQIDSPGKRRSFQNKLCDASLLWLGSLLFSVAEPLRLWGVKVLSASAYHLILSCMFCTLLLHRGYAEITESLHMAQPRVNRMMMTYGYFLIGSGFKVVSENKKLSLSHGKVMLFLTISLHISVFCY